MFNFRNLFSNEDEDKKNIIDIVTGIAGASIPGKKNNNSTSENSSSVFDNIRNMFSENNNSIDDHEAPNSNNTTMADYETLYNELMNREPFQYDVNGDALYQQYKDNYIQQGKMAMEDAMGQMSSLTGGYASSAAMSAGQQAYQGELSKLNDIVPDLYQNALNKYMMEGEDLYNQYAMAYGQHRDDIADKRYEDEVAYKNATDFYTSGGKVGYDNGSLTPTQVAELTHALGIDTNGQWNSAAYEATEMTADEAWAHYQEAQKNGESFYYAIIANDIDTFIELGSKTRKELQEYVAEAYKKGLITKEEKDYLYDNVISEKVADDYVPGVGEDAEKLKEKINDLITSAPDGVEYEISKGEIDRAYKAGEITETERDYLLEYYGLD